MEESDSKLLVQSITVRMGKNKECHTIPTSDASFGSPQKKTRKKRADKETAKNTVKKSKGREEGEESDSPSKINLKVMLANVYDPDKVDPTGWYMSEKLDGVRCYWDG